VGLLEELALSKVKEEDEDAARSVLKVRQVHCLCGCCVSKSRPYIAAGTHSIPILVEQPLQQLQAACLHDHTRLMLCLNAPPWPSCA
jgi:CDGSH-type Zn-finger protein